jgi:hypothetical protein
MTLHAYCPPNDSWPVPALPAFLKDADAPVAQEIREQHAAALEATKAVRETHNVALENRAAHDAARDALRLELERGVRDGRDVAKEKRLAAKVAEAAVLDSSEANTIRRNAAVQAQQAAVTAYDHAVREHAPELVALLVPVAEKSIRDMNAARERFAPIQLAHAQAVSDLALLANGRASAADLQALVNAHAEGAAA